MAYFLGRDVKVAVSTENTTNGFLNTSGVATVSASATTSGTDILKRNSIDVGAGTGVMKDVTGVDLTLGAVDEDIAYMGQRTALKAEIKKESTIVITRKQKDAFWSDMWTTGYRWGCVSTATTEASATEVGLAQPSGTEFGFRLYVALKDTEQNVTLAGCTFTEYTTTLNTDGVTEETLTFMTHVTPKVAAEEDDTTALGSTPFLL
jgi:hypothetical protein|tara:strand:+ start:291 stop:908 length:618 start_codon:yes stop_codon:yes gene_type:complete